MQCVKKENMRIIKKYENRKLYDTETSKTVTLKDIAELIREGVEIKVVDNSDKDVTNKVMAQIFLQENLETKQLVLSKFLLEFLIKEGTKIESLIKKVLLSGVGLANLTQEKAEQLVNELVKRGELDESEGAKFVKELISKIEKGSKDIKTAVKGFVQDISSKSRKSKSDEISEKEEESTKIKEQIEDESKKEEKSTNKKSKVG
jgi:polyhydroxyalkanoate synthesis repressor PhaR